MVDIVGSHKHEKFEVTRLNAQETRVRVYKTSKAGDVRVLRYHRTFDHRETRELRLYGLAGNDQFLIKGDVDAGLRVIAVGGPGNDLFTDTSTVRGKSKRTRYYDIPDGTTVHAGAETRVKLSRDVAINRYDFEGFKYDLARPIAYFGSNKDDGLFVGGGIRITRHGFRKNPHAVIHQFMGNVAAKTQAFNLRYLGHYTEVFYKWDLGIDLAIYNPNNIRNFYGLGNETENDDFSARFYQARFSRFTFRSQFERSYDQGITLRWGPFVEMTNVRNDENRNVSDPQLGIADRSLDRLFYGGVEATVQASTLDQAANPTQGFTFEGAATIYGGLGRDIETYTTFSSQLSLYISPSLDPQITFAVRAGGAHSVGPFPLFCVQYARG